MWTWNNLKYSIHAIICLSRIPPFHIESYAGCSLYTLLTWLIKVYPGPKPVNKVWINFSIAHTLHQLKADKLLIPTIIPPLSQTSSTTASKMPAASHKAPALYGFCCNRHLGPDLPQMYRHLVTSVWLLYTHILLQSGPWGALGSTINSGHYFFVPVLFWRHIIEALSGHWRGLE